MSFSRFFGHDINFDLAMKPFTWQHYLLIFLGIMCVVFTLKFAKTIKTSKYEPLIKKVFIGWLIVLELSYHIHYWAYGLFSVPLHVCSFGVMFSILLLVTGKYRYFEVLFFVGIFGGLLALFIPNTLGYTYYNMRYYHFIFLHMSIAMVPIYYYKAYDYRITYRSIYKTIGLFLCLLPLVMYVNYTFDKNYMFIGEKPEILAGILPDWPYYVFIFVGLTPILFHVLHFISNFDYKKITFKK
ncbi:MAG: TIGR02206 family membrane protein [Firmicutes bacterium]|nr:TIGR02206 family membrane protein [Bacillota bacterium]